MTSFADHRETDLFGQPVRPNKGRRGRPALQVTNEGRDMLEMACARGWPNARIAEAVGISVPSLKRHFAPRSELRRPRGLARAAGRPIPSGATAP
jgi:FixJ family two-component response regulator